MEINERAIIGESHGKNHQISVNEILKLEKYNDSTEDTILKTLLLIPLAVGVFFEIILKKTSMMDKAEGRLIQNSRICILTRALQHCLEMGLR